MIDRATEEAIQRLIDAGLIARSTRAARPLYPESVQEESAPLTPAEQAQAQAHRNHGARKLKMAQLLGGGGMAEEARPALLEAALACGCAMAIEHRLPAPTKSEELLHPPLSHGWEAVLPVLHARLPEGSAS